VGRLGAITRDVVRRALAMVMLMSALAAADPDVGTKSPDIGTTTPPELQTAKVAQDHEDAHPVASVAILGGLYVGFSSWAYAAWYVKHKPLGYFKWGGDGWLGDQTYAGGADKFGHAWATMSLARAGTLLLHDYGGYDKQKSVLVSAALSETLFFFVEVKDGFFYEFSFSDLSGDTAGAIAAVLLDSFPRLDEMFDYRVQYFPSHEYLDNVNHGNGYNRLNIAEDYSGETYLLAYHLGSIHALDQYGPWSKFVDIAAGFDTRGYKPSPPMGYPPNEHRQNIFLGVSFNAQGFFDWLFTRESTAKPRVRKVTHGLFEIFNLPYTSAPLLEDSRTPTGAVMTGGA
jgi:hypothetical protein